MREIDGSHGGGQVVRTALSLSMLTGDALALEGIRGDRSDPGLSHQHLTAVETAARVCDAAVDGAELGSTELSFDPGVPTGGTYEADIGTAGSVTLLFDTLLPVASRLENPLTFTATGGTDVKWAPPMAYYRRVKLPFLRDRDLGVAVDEHRPGFYPAGGGSATLHVWPSDPTPITVPRARESGETARIYSKASTSLADAEVADRQATAAATELDESDIETVGREVSYAETSSPGSAVVVQLTGDDPRGRQGSVAGFDAYGEPGTPAEDVARTAVAAVREFLPSAAPVDVHLADQLLVVLALAGGQFALPRVSDHVAACLPVFEAFDFDVTVDESETPPVVSAPGR